MVTVDEVFELYDTVTRMQERAPTPSVWMVSPRVRNRLAKVSLRFRKLWPAARALKRDVHRSYRRAGQVPPRVPRKGPWGGRVAKVTYGS